MDNPQYTFRPHLLALSVALPAVAFSAFVTAETPVGVEVHSSEAATTLSTSTLNTKVMNGETASSIANDLLPWQAAIMTNEIRGGYYSGCGAVIISDYWAVTAAHCLEDYLNFSDTLIAGTTFIGNTRGEANTVDDKYKFNIVRKIMHSQYDSSGNLDHDIGLIQVDRPLTSVAKPIKVATPSEQAIANQEFTNTWTPSATIDANVIASGWGNTLPNFTQPDELMVVKMAGIPLDQCVEGLTIPDDVNLICVDSNVPDVKKDVCAGDSGGPLIWQNPNHSGDSDYGLRVIGVTSFGPYCEDKFNNTPSGEYPGFYTELAAYTNWIDLYTQLDISALPTSTFSHNPFDLVSEDITAKETETTVKSSGGGSMPLGLLASLMALAFWRRQRG